LELKNRWLSYSRAAVDVNIMKLRLRNYKISLVLDVILGDITLVNRLSRFRACSEKIKSGSAKPFLKSRTKHFLKNQC
jgi:hypothetical protein